MFYSQTFLARKGPLGTVWCAAHLQNRLKKSHYASTDIPSTVDRIICPEVPIALRMLGHLLLGVVRIHSKQVDYLFHDCQSALTELIKVCTLVQVNLPEEARQATVEAITLPETFDLDALELDDDFHHARSPDNHLRSMEDITLTDQVPTWRDTYVAITFDEDIEFQDTLRIPIPDSDVPPYEVIRDASRDDSPGRLQPLFLNEKDRATEPPPSLDQAWSGKEFETPNLRASAGVSATSQQRSDSPAVAFEETDKRILGNGTPNFNIHQSPPVQQPKRRRRRRGNFFDERIVLPNNVIQKSLEDASDIVQKRRKLSGTRLGLWKLNHSLRKEKIFDDPAITGLSLAIREMFEEGYISSKPHLLVSEEAQPEVGEAQSPPSGADQSTTPVPEVDMGMETLRDDGGANNSIFPLSPQPSPTGHISSPTGVGVTGFTPGSLVSELSPEQGGSAVPSEQQTPDIAASAGPDGSEHGAPMDLQFLAADDNTPSGSPASQGRTMSVRTRAVAQYLKKSTPSSGDLSLNKILEGKPRKLCARMFFETLVLKSHDLIDVQQEEPYGAIVLKVATLRKAQL